jgi:pimeloyl-ACP methyl ester carboxylesterase
VLTALCATLGCDAGSSDSFYNITGGKEAFAMSASSHAAKPTIILVHGALAGALSFQELIPLLQQRNYQVIAVENTLT